MEQEYDKIASIIQSRARTHKKRRFLVAMAGVPGAGKTTTASAVARRLNSNSSHDNTARTALLPMDGFHLSRATLDQLPNREEAYIRRGAPWTFDVGRFVTFVHRLREWADQDYDRVHADADADADQTDSIALSSPSTTSHSRSQSEPLLLAPCQPGRSQENVLYAPSFDHEAGDPVENGIAITDDISIVIIEGNYLLLDAPEWREVSRLVDYRVFIDTDLQEARERVAQRHMAAGIERSLEDGFRRVDSNDYLNALMIREKMIQPELVVRSIHESG